MVLADQGVENIGGHALDLVLANHFAEIIDAQPERKNLPSVKKNTKLMSRLLQECNKIKEVLSANKEALFQVEGLVDGNDFKSKIERKVFEEKSEKIF